MPAFIHQRAEHISAKNPSMPKSEAFALATQQSHALGKSPKGYGTSEGRATAKAKYDTPKDDKKTANPGGLESAKFASFAAELVKLSVSAEWLKKHVAAGMEALPTKLPPEGVAARIPQFMSRAASNMGKAIQRDPAAGVAKHKALQEGMTEGLARHYSKQASVKLSFAPGGALSRIGGALANPNVREHGTELAGLGILAAPGLDTLQAHARARFAGDKGPGAVEKRQFMGEAGHAAADVGGLGVLMGPEIAKLMKHGGVLDTLKRVAMTDIPGTKPWVLGNVEKATANAAKGALRPAAMSGVHRIGSQALGNGVYDVSSLARKMGV